MSRKRTLPDVYRTRKRMAVIAPSANQSSQTANGITNGIDWSDGEQPEVSTNHAGTTTTATTAAPTSTANTIIPNDTSCALTYLKNLFPVDKFDGRLPPIMLKHQLYGIFSRTLVDQQLTTLRSNGEIRLFKMGSEPNHLCILFTQDYKAHVRKYVQSLNVNHAVVEKFLSLVIDQCQDVSLSKQKMMHELHFKDEEITHLVKACMLTVRDVGSWWIAIPGAGIFMKSFIRGRKAVLTMIRKCKYKEIIREELKTRKLPRVAKLGMEYYIHDLIGADLVGCVPTTSGMLLRLQE